MDVELKPCPFGCDYRPYVRDSGHDAHWVRCDGCSADGPVRGSEADAITAWNTRAVLQPPPAVGDRGAVARKLAELRSGDFEESTEALQFGYLRDADAILALLSPAIPQEVEEAALVRVPTIVLRPFIEAANAAMEDLDDGYTLYEIDSTVTLGDCREVRRAALQAHCTGKAGEWALVPAEPTGAMIDAALAGDHRWSLNAIPRLEAAYRAMLSAAPAKPQDGWRDTPLGRFCDACQSLKPNGRCNLPGCPLPAVPVHQVEDLGVASGHQNGGDQ